MRHWFWRGKSSLIRQLQPYWVTVRFFVVSQNNRWDVAHTAIAYFYSVPIKDLMEFICFREVLFCQVKKGLTNIRFDICRIRWIIPYYFSLSLFIVIFAIFILYWCITQVLLKSTFIQSIPVNWFSFFKNFSIWWQIR